MIFAIFLIKPTPFCLLDEVDAPLDEANVGRYNDMLRDLTMDIWQRHSGFQRVFRKVPGRLLISQREHEGIMAALRAHDSDEAARLALLHKRSVQDSVSTLVDESGVEA